MFDEVRESGEEGGVDCEDSEVERDAGHEVKDSAIQRVTDNYGKVPLWHSSITPPSDIQEEELVPPKTAPRTAFVHGIRSGDVRNNLQYNGDGHVVYTSSTYGIVFDGMSRSSASMKATQRLSSPWQLIIAAEWLPRATCKLLHNSISGMHAPHSR